MSRKGTGGATVAIVRAPRRAGTADLRRISMPDATLCCNCMSDGAVPVQSTKEPYQRVIWAMRSSCLRQKRGQNVPKIRNETQPSGGSGPLIVSRRSRPSRSMALHTADELECDAHGRSPLGLRGECMMPAMLSEGVDSPQHLHTLHDCRWGWTGGTDWDRVGLSGVPWEEGCGKGSWERPRERPCPCRTPLWPTLGSWPGVP